MPAFGFAVGMERLISLMPGEIVPSEGIDLAIVCLGREGWEAAVDMARKIRGEGWRVVMPLTGRPMGAQLKRAGRLGARFALFVGRDELEAGRFGLKDFTTGEQIEVDETGLLVRLGED